MPVVTADNAILPQADALLLLALRVTGSASEAEGIVADLHRALDREGGPAPEVRRAVSARALHALRETPGRRSPLRAALARLPDPQAIAFLLHDVERLPLDEVASILATEVGAARLLLDRATAALLPHLDDVATLRAAALPEGAADRLRHRLALRVREPSPPDFAAELRRQIRNTPWYTVSLVLHAILLLLLDLLTGGSPPLPDPPLIHATVDLALPAPEVFEETDPKLPDLPPEEALLERAIAEDTPPEEPDPVPEPPAEPERPDLSTRILGLGHIGTPLPTDLDDAQRKAAKLATQGLGEGLQKVRAIAKDRILVVKGLFDRIEAVLEVHAIPHTVVEGLRGRTLRADQVLFVNCGRAPLGFEPERVAAFVREGGWLMTSDWALEPYVTESFPDLVRIAQGAPRQRDVVVEIAEAAPGHPLLRGALDPKRKLLWWLEDESVFFRLSGSAEVLVRSEEMKRRFGTEVVAFTKAIGKGRIAHVLGHFLQEQGTLEGVAGMQRVILNFVSANLER